MTEIIPGLQGDLPAKSQKGIPFVAGKYVSFPLFSFSSELDGAVIISSNVFEGRYHINHMSCPDVT